MRNASAVRRGLVMMTVLVGAVMGVAAAAEDMPSGEKVVQRYVKAVGGRGAIQKVTSFHVKGTYHMPAYGADGTIELHFVRPDRLLFQVELPGIGSIRRSLVGDTGWSMDPHQSPQILEKSGLDSLRKQAARGFSLLPGSPDLKAGKSVEKVEFDGRPCYKVTMTVVGTGEEWVDYYDVETGLFAGRVEYYASAQGKIKVEGFASEYRKFGDLLVATHWKHNGGGQEWTAIYEAVDFGAVDPEVFTFPAEVAALMDNTQGD